MENETKIWFLAHSTFAIKTKNHFLIFDYYKDTPVRNPRCLETGVIEPEEIKDENVIVFSSHGHLDHFDPVIFDWKNKVDNIHYVLASDIQTGQSGKNIYFVDPHHSYAVDDVYIDVLDSTDEGVAFVVDVDGITLFHSGDLNWWHWKGESDRWNRQMEADYKREMMLLKNKYIDLAFIPVDPRLEEFYSLSLKYFMNTVGARMVFPMHFWNDYSIFEKMKHDDTKELLAKVANITQRGQLFLYTKY